MVTRDKTSIQNFSQSNISSIICGQIISISPYICYERLMRVTGDVQTQPVIYRSQRLCLLNFT